MDIHHTRDTEMSNIHLDRFCYSEMGAFGRLVYEDFECYTIERPWDGNKPNVSCIPLGLYQLKPSYYFRGGYDSYEVLDVPDRSEIKIHIGNTLLDVIGCIAVGEKLGYINGRWAVMNSEDTFKRVMQTCAEYGHPENIIITNFAGGD